MEIIKDFDKVEAKGMDDFKALPIGAYECVIKEAEIYKSEQSGKESLRIAVDIASGEYKDYFQKRFDSNPNMDKRWDANGTKYLAFQGDNVSFFKGFITTIENSNVGYKWNWDEKTLVGKKVCGVFLYEEYENQDGEKKVKVRLNKFRSLDKMKEIEVSYNVRLLNGTYMSIDDYNERKEEKNISTADDMVEIDSSFLD